MTAAGLTLQEAQQALAKCSKSELAILSEATPHEASLMLEAKLFGDATILDGLTERSLAEDEARDAARVAREGFARLFDKEAA